MPEDVYTRLARFLDDLPAGYRPARDGAGLRILQRLFTPAEAELATHLTLFSEPAEVMARRAHIPLEEARTRLAEMAHKGLVYETIQNGEPHYMAAQFVIGIWEFQVGRLTPELIHDMDEYGESGLDWEAWKRTPQLRTIPVNESVVVSHEVLAHEQGVEIIKHARKLAVAPCICRRERQMMSEGCGKLLEACILSNDGADYYVRNGWARFITQTEALGILRQADEQGLVLQPGNSRDASMLCCCCGDCCGVLRRIKLLPRPADYVSSAFSARQDPALCSSCGQCLERCQMDALSMGDMGIAVLDESRCIGCGLCVSTCPSGALNLERKPDSQQPYVPRTTSETYIRLGSQRGKLGTLAKMLVQNLVDRLRTGQ
jgi:electron transport complex protein RnfB